jgi:glycosyltransferase involved in cell wall biosynthesis
MLSIVIPVYNEKELVTRLVDVVCEQALEKEVIIVNDGSVDGSTEIIEQVILKAHPEIRYFKHETNKGKGAAIRKGFEMAKGDFVVIQDADLEYDPKDLKSMVEVFRDSGIDVVYGSRFLAGRKVTHFLHYAVNQMITMFGNLLYGARLTDLETCYKMFRKPVLDSLHLVSDGFEIEAEMTGKVFNKGFRIKEVPIYYRGRNYDQGKKITWVDGFKALWSLVKYRLKKS